MIPSPFTFSEHSNYGREILPYLPQVNFSANNLNFHWMWWDWIKAIFLNLFYFNIVAPIHRIFLIYLCSFRKDFNSFWPVCIVVGDNKELNCWVALPYMSVEGLDKLMAGIHVRFRSLNLAKLCTTIKKGNFFLF